MKCSKCKEDKEEDKFRWRNTNCHELGRQRICKSCETIARRSYPKKSGRSGKMNDRARLEQRTKKFGMTVEEHNNMLLIQNGVCKICGGIGQRELAIDHNHVTKKVRALLCTRCNIGLGYFKDNPELLKKAASYLELHNY